jgi:hypothetical protein
VESATEVAPEIYGVTTMPASGEYDFCANRVSTPRTLPFEPAYRKIGTARLRDSAREVERAVNWIHNTSTGEGTRCARATRGSVTWTMPLLCTP